MQHAQVTDPERLHDLLHAIVALESELTVEAVHRAIVTQACSLVGAREATLAVVGNDGRDPTPLVHTKHRAPSARGAGHATSEAPGYDLRVPIRIRDQVYAYLYLAGRDDGARLSAEDVGIAEAFAMSAGGAVDNARLHAQVVDLGVAAERVRIAHDLHDTVLQRLFAIGLSLQSALKEDPEVTSARVRRAIDDLDETIQQVRAAIFALEPAVRGRQRLGARLLDVIRWSAELLSIEPTVRFVGPVDRALDEPVVAGLILSLREALGELARRGATSVSVEVEASGEPRARELVLRVAAAELGDGAEPGGPAARRRGADRSASAADDDWLAGMVVRAEALDGSCGIRTRVGGTTELSWRVPLAPR
ncbi:MAG TPA: histidine kinase [Acidimicrobiales bacterium]|nr:histidine kinase [Acidimicrobiales bacterium]